MKVKIVFLFLIMTVIISLMFMPANKAETKKSLTLEEKVDLLLKKQDEVIKKLDEVLDELKRIKIRVSRIRNQ